MKFLNRAAALLLAISLVLPGVGLAADDAKSKKIRIDTTASGVQTDAAINQFPLLVRLHSGNFTFSEAKPDGSDLRFFSADGKTPLKFHIERFDATNELAMVWVQLPSLASNTKNESIQLRWGGQAAGAGADSKGTYDAQQLMVLHFEQGDAVKDASASALVSKESSARLGALGAIGQAAGFDGSGRVVFAAAPALKLSGADGWTWSGWVKPAGDSGTLFAVGNQVSVGLSGGNPVATVGGQTVRGSTALKAGSWQHLAVTHAGGKVQIFVNGAAAGEGAANLTEASGEAVIGQGFKGEIDEMALSKGARSPAYIKALAGSQMAESTLLAFAEEGGDEGGISYFSILLGAVTLDGWVVIGLLGIMGAVSIWVMVSKTLQLQRSEKANQAFLNLFAQHSATMLDPAHMVVQQLTGMKEVSDSSIYKLYKVGMHEIAQRFEAQAKGGKQQHLTAPALESIRAALDATIVRSNQKFNQGIVLLTIAISGGPFLGLLGTVVGVMITFAAIAAAGDVNVNAIAPGIAAALVATVAGLAVAIPALFAYNWFAIKIKNVGADTQVFADEFLTKSAELYSV